MTIPPPAFEILSLIRVTETGRADATAYETIYGHNEKKLSKPITAMTVNELQSHQPGFTKNFGSSASGAYQFMLATLRDLEIKARAFRKRNLQSGAARPARLRAFEAARVSGVD